MPPAIRASSRSRPRRRDGVPSARTVLLRGVDERGFVFYTGYESRKASELDRPAAWAALLFHWDDPGRQVRSRGR